MDARILIHDPKVDSSCSRQPEVPEMEQEFSSNSTGVQDSFLGDIKYSYSIMEPTPGVFHGWFGHQEVKKRFQLFKGSFVIMVVQPDDWENPSEYLKVTEYILSDKNQQIDIPGGYVVGYKALIAASEMEISSNFSQEESAEKEYKFDEDSWYFETFF